MCLPRSLPLCTAHAPILHHSKALRNAPMGSGVRNLCSPGGRDFYKSPGIEESEMPSFLMMSLLALLGPREMSDRRSADEP